MSEKEQISLEIWHTDLQNRVCINLVNIRGLKWKKKKPLCQVLCKNLKMPGHFVQLGVNVLTLESNRWKES